MSHMNDTLTRWCNQTLTVYHATSTFDSYGNPALSTNISLSAIVQRTLKLVRGRDGKEKIATTEIILHSTDAIGYLDKITLPTGEQPEILAIESPVDFYGDIEYYRVFT